MDWTYMQIGTGLKFEFVVNIIELMPECPTKIINFPIYWLYLFIFIFKYPKMETNSIITEMV